MEELSQATKNFSDKNLIGEGKFGEVYKGLLHDGMLVAIKKRQGLPSQEFVDEVVISFLSPSELGFTRQFNIIQGRLFSLLKNRVLLDDTLWGIGMVGRELIELFPAELVIVGPEC